MKTPIPLEKSYELGLQGVDIEFIDSRMSGVVSHQEWKCDWPMHKY